MGKQQQATTTKGTVKGAPDENLQTAGALATQSGGAVSTDVIDYSADAGKGMEKVDADSVAIPFLVVLQKNSPQCDPDDTAEYIKDAKPGMLFNTLTREIFDGKEGIKLVPCYYDRKFLRWTPREKGGGFKGEIPIAEVVKMREKGAIVEQDNRLYIPDAQGNVNPKEQDKVADTRVHYVLLINERSGRVQPMVLSLASTQIKKSRQLNALLGDVQFERPDGTKFNPATWANIVHMVTVPESNEKGSWSGVKFEIAGRVQDAAVYAAGRSFKELVSAGRANVNFDQAAAAQGADEEERAFD